MSVEGTRRRLHPSTHGYFEKLRDAVVDYDEFTNRPEGTPNKVYVTCTIGRGAVSVSRLIAPDASAATIASEKVKARAGLVAVLRELADKIEAFGNSIAPDAVQG